MRVAVVLAWPVLVLAAGARWAPRRRLELPVATRSVRSSGRGAAVLASVGRCIRGRLRRPPDAAADRALGLGLLGGLLLLPVAPLAAPVPLLLAVGLPRWHRARAARRARAEVVEELPDVIDLLTLAAGSGVTAVLAADAVGRHAGGPVGRALAEASRRIGRGEPPALAFAGVAAATRAEDAVRPLGRVLVTAVEEGVPLEPALRRIGADAHLRRRRAAEEAARTVPVRLLFPLVACTLPAFVVLTVVPLLVVGLDSLDL